MLWGLESRVAEFRSASVLEEGTSLRARVYKVLLEDVVGYPSGWYVDFDGHGSLGPYSTMDDAFQQLKQWKAKYGSHVQIARQLQREAWTDFVVANDLDPDEFDPDLETFMKREGLELEFPFAPKAESENSYLGLGVLLRRWVLEFAARWGRKRQPPPADSSGGRRAGGRR